MTARYSDSPTVRGAPGGFGGGEPKWVQDLKEDHRNLKQMLRTDQQKELDGLCESIHRQLNDVSGQGVDLSHEARQGIDEALGAFVAVEFRMLDVLATMRTRMIGTLREFQSTIDLLRRSRQTATDAANGPSWLVQRVASGNADIPSVVDADPQEEALREVAKVANAIRRAAADVEAVTPEIISVPLKNEFMPAFSNLTGDVDAAVRKMHVAWREVTDACRQEAAKPLALLRHEALQASGKGIETVRTLGLSEPEARVWQRQLVEYIQDMNKCLAMGGVAPMERPSFARAAIAATQPEDGRPSVRGPKETGGRPASHAFPAAPSRMSGNGIPTGSKRIRGMDDGDIDSVRPSEARSAAPVRAGSQRVSGGFAPPGAVAGVQRMPPQQGRPPINAEQDGSDDELETSRRRTLGNLFGLL